MTDAQTIAIIIAIIRKSGGWEHIEEAAAEASRYLEVAKLAYPQVHVGR
jgi:hypothetical protein